MDLRAIAVMFCVLVVVSVFPPLLLLVVAGFIAFYMLLEKPMQRLFAKRKPETKLPTNVVSINGRNRK